MEESISGEADYKMDILPDENNLDDGVMVFGITLLKKEERYEGE